jgi:hypothetical protein
MPDTDAAGWDSGVVAGAMTNGVTAIAVAAVKESAVVRYERFKSSTGSGPFKTGSGSTPPVG